MTRAALGPVGELPRVLGKYEIMRKTVVTMSEMIMHINNTHGAKKNRKNKTKTLMNSPPNARGAYHAKAIAAIITIAHASIENPKHANAPFQFMGRILARV